MERSKANRRKAALTLQFSLFSWQLCGELFVRRQGMRHATHRSRTNKHVGADKTPSLLRA